jgi:hypothetical protein
VASRYFIKVNFFIIVVLIIGLGGSIIVSAKDNTIRDKLLGNIAILKERIKDLEKIVNENRPGSLREKIEQIRNELDKSMERREEELSKTSEEAKQKRIKEIEGKSNIKTMVTKDPILLSQYFGCKAVLENDMDMCNNIQNPNGIKECQQNFYTFPLFLDKIIRDKRITSDILDTCKQIFSGSEGDCRLIIDACLSGDTSAISTMPYFAGIEGLIELAFISGDNKYCGDIISQSEKTDCNSNVAYISAIKSGLPQRCLEIENVSLRTICQLYFNKDKSICEESLKTQISQRRK